MLRTHSQVVKIRKRNPDSTEIFEENLIDNSYPDRKIYDPSKDNESESYYYSLLLLFVPFRNEGDLIDEGETAETAFNRHLEENNTLNTYSEKLQQMLKAKEHVQKINETRKAQEENVPALWKTTMVLGWQVKRRQP